MILDSNHEAKMYCKGLIIIIDVDCRLFFEGAVTLLLLLLLLLLLCYCYLLLLLLLLPVKMLETGNGKRRAEDRRQQAKQKWPMTITYYMTDNRATATTMTDN